MIYIDTSVVLAHLLVEGRRPPPALWTEPLVASRLLEYEVWCRLNARRLAATHGAAAQRALAQISFVELSPLVLARVLEPFPLAIRTLDALHLATIEFLRERRLAPRRASYDRRMIEAAESLGIPTMPLS